MIEVIAITEHSPDGMKRYKVGQRYSVSSSAARILVATKKVRIYVPAEEAPKERKRYERRDMRAED